MLCVQSPACVNPQPDTMAGYDPQNLSRTKAAASGFSNVSPFTSGNTGLSFRHTEPTQGNHSGSVWHGTSEGQQYFHQDPLSQGTSQTGFSDSFNVFPAPQITPSGQVIGHGPISGTSGNQWSAEVAPAHGEAMSRLPSQDSVGAHSYTTTSTANSYDHTGSARMYPSLSQKSFHISSARSDVTGRSSPDNFAVYTPRQQQPMDLQTFDHFPYTSGEEFSSSHSIYQRGEFKLDVSSNTSLNSGSSYSMFPNTSEDGFTLLSAQIPVTRDTLMYNTNMLNESPIWDNAAFPDSQRSSPMPLEDWSLPAQMASTTSSPLEYSPSVEAISPQFGQDFSEITDLPPYTTGDRVVKKPIGPRPSKVASDMAARSQRFPGTSETSDESRFVGRSSINVDNTARDNPLYQNVTVQADGFYHCPWEGKEGCGHKPEKLKCNYDKFVDSHLKPYRCGVNACGDSRFSSTACLLRHEREAHAMHGHGDKPYLCTYEGCERSAAGNGFPRHWNLRDHMRRVHNDSGATKSNASGSPPPSAPLRGKNKRKADAADPSPMEKPIKRVATPPVVIKQDPGLIEHYRQNERRLLEVVQQLHDPRNAQNMDLLRNASDCIKLMAQTTQRINGAPPMTRNFSQQSS